LRVGPGSSYRCKIIGQNIGSGTSGVQSYTIPGAPTTLGNPTVFANANAQMTTGYIRSVSIQVTGTNSFQYWKRLQLGNSTGNFTESFNFVAYWI
jgi:hypothetical protein